MSRLPCTRCALSARRLLRDSGNTGCGGESACTPDSVPAPCGTGGDHPSRPAVTRRLQRPTRGCVTRAPRGRAVLPLSDLAPGGVYRAARVTPGAGALLPHRCTLACASRLPGPPSAVCSLWHCPAGRPDWVLPSTMPCGVRTFLGRVEPARGRPADSPPRAVIVAPRRRNPDRTAPSGDFGQV